MHIHTFASLLFSCHICIDLSRSLHVMNNLCSLFMLQKFPSLWLSFDFAYSGFFFGAEALNSYTFSFVNFLYTSGLHILFRESFSEHLFLYFFPH